MRSSIKALIIFIFVISIILSGIYIYGQTEVEAASVSVEITQGAPFTSARFNESERDGLIGNVSLKKIYVNKFAEPRGSSMYLPGISVALFSNKRMISEWISVPLQDKGTYELTVGLNQPLNKSDVIRIAVYINDDKGQVIIGKRKDVVWD